MSAQESRDNMASARTMAQRRGAAAAISRDYRSVLIDQLQEAGLCLRVGCYEFLLPERFGFCCGVQRALNRVYETRRQYPERRVYITAEMIHNPTVNAQLHRMGILFLDRDVTAEDPLTTVRPEDVVIIPAFGAAVEVMQRLGAIGCTMVDTTCGSVLNVWRRVEEYNRDGFTAVVHGRYTHEETRATCSRAAHYLVVRDEQEARMVCAYLRGQGDRTGFMAHFAPACSDGFEPDRDLERIGLANQTTMLTGESLRIGEMLREAVAERHDDADDHFRSFDTICNATQQRQDAVKNLLEDGLDVMLVVGGTNSCNTANLCRLAARNTRAFHIDDETCIESLDRIRHCVPGAAGWQVAEHWFPETARRIGVASGASTPDSSVERVIRRMTQLLGCDTELRPVT